MNDSIKRLQANPNELKKRLYKNINKDDFIILNGNGKDIIQRPDISFLRGMNFSGQEFINGRQWPRKEAVDYYVGKQKMSVIRLEFLWELMQPTLNGPLDPDYVAGWHILIDQITSMGACVLFDCHNYGERKVADITYLIGETATVTGAHLGDMWSKVVTEFGLNNPKFIPEIMNEPHGNATVAWRSVNNTVYTAIRNTGFTGEIVCSPNIYNITQLDSTRLAEMLNVVDPLGKPINIAVHLYPDLYSSGQLPVVQNNPVTLFNPFTTWANTNGKRLVVTEIAAPVSEAGKTWMTNALNHFESNKNVYWGWALHNGGGWQEYEYFYRQDPYASEWKNDNPDRNIALGGTGRATTWADPQTDVFIAQYHLPFIPGARKYNGPSKVAPKNFTTATEAYPSLVGTPIVGQPLVVSPGWLTGYPDPILTFKIFKNGSTLVASGSLPLSYTPVTGDIGATFTVERTATDADGNTAVLSSTATAAVVAASTILSSSNKASTVTISNGGLTASLNGDPGVAWPLVRATGAASSGLKGFSFIPSAVQNSAEVGLIPDSYTIAGTTQLGDITNGLAWRGNGDVVGSGGYRAGAMPAWTAGQVHDLVVNHSTGMAWGRKNNGNWNNNPSANPDTGVGGVSFTGSVARAPAAACYYVNFTFDFTTPYAFTMPSGMGDY